MATQRAILPAIVASIATVLAGCLNGGAEPSNSRPLTSPSPTAEVTTEPSPSAEAEAPTWTLDILGQLECDGPPANLGNEIGDFGGLWVGETPEAALDSFLGPGNPYASLPLDGYTELHVDAHWASYAHLVDGHAKAIILLGDESELGPGWAVLALRACDASEFDPSTPLSFPVTVWTDANGNRLPTTTIRSALGPGHCNWDVIWLQMSDALFFRDVEGKMTDFTTSTFAVVDEVPAAAVDTGFRSGELALWIDPVGDAYLVSPDQIERWPRSTEPHLACA